MYGHKYQYVENAVKSEDYFQKLEVYLLEQIILLTFILKFYL